LDGLLRLRVVFHLHEAEAARASGLAVGNHLSAAHLAVLAEQFQEIVVGRVPHEIADIDILRHSEKPFRAGCRPRPCAGEEAAWGRGTCHKKCQKLPIRPPAPWTDPLEVDAHRKPRPDRTLSSAPSDPSTPTQVQLDTRSVLS